MHLFTCGQFIPLYHRRRSAYSTGIASIKGSELAHPHQRSAGLTLSLKTQLYASFGCLEINLEILRNDLDVILFSPEKKYYAKLISGKSFYFCILLFLPMYNRAPARPC